MAISGVSSKQMLPKFSIIICFCGFHFHFAPRSWLIVILWHSLHLINAAYRQSTNFPHGSLNGFSEVVSFSVRSKKNRDKRNENGTIIWFTVNLYMSVHTKHASTCTRHMKELCYRFVHVCEYLFIHVTLLLNPKTFRSMVFCPGIFMVRTKCEQQF